MRRDNQDTGPAFNPAAFGDDDQASAFDSCSELAHMHKEYPEQFDDNEEEVEQFNAANAKTCCHGVSLDHGCLFCTVDDDIDIPF